MNNDVLSAQTAWDYGPRWIFLQRRRSSTRQPWACCAAPARRYSGRSVLLLRGMAFWSACRRWFGAAPFHLAGPGILAVFGCQRTGRSRRAGLAPRHRVDAVRRPAARAVELFGYVYVPLGHGSIIQPSCAAVGGLDAGAAGAREALPWRRIVGALIIVLGLAVIGIEALRTMGAQGLFGDGLFFAAGTRPRCSACCCGCGGFRRSGPRRSPVCCRSPACRSWLSLMAIFLPRGLGRTCCRRSCKVCSPAQPEDRRP